MGRRKPRKLAVVNGQRVALVAAMSAILVRAEPTPFAFEGPLIAGIRAELLLAGRGWKWQMADTAARELVGEALRKAGAKRPTWLEGQPHYAHGGNIFTIRTRCAKCCWRLPEGHRVFCSRRCANAFHSARYERRIAAERAIVAEATRAAR